MKKYIMSIDQGTTGTTVTLVDLTGSPVASSEMDFKQFFPNPGWVEHDPELIWQSLETSATAVMKKAGIRKNQIVTVGITNQRETVVAWSRKTGKALAPAIVWQCRRTTDFCKKMQPKYGALIKKKTGLQLDPYFSASKMKWLLDNNTNVKKAFLQQDLLFGTIDSFLIFRLTAKKSHATDVTNASRTMLMNLKKLNWDEQLLRIFKIPKQTLPVILSSADDFGFCKSISFLDDNTPINGVIGDQQSALFGQACYKEGDAKCTFGTGSFILLNTGKKITHSKSRCLSTVAWKIKSKPAVYALEGGAFVCGAAVQWLRDGLGLIKNSNEIEALANSVSSTGGVEFVPALVGMGVPHWNAQARGEITGLTRGTTRAHIARATLEAMALQNVEILKSMETDLKVKITQLKVDGGACANNLLMQMQSNFLQRSVVRPKNIETTSIGAAYIAGIGAGIWDSELEIRKIWKSDRLFKYLISKSDAKKRMAKWQKVIKKCLAFL